MKYLCYLILYMTLYIPLTFTMDVDKLTKKEQQRWFSQHILLIMQHQVYLLKSQEQLLVQIKSLQQMVEKRFDLQDERLDRIMRDNTKD